MGASNDRDLATRQKVQQQPMWELLVTTQLSRLVKGRDNWFTVLSAVGVNARYDERWYYSFGAVLWQWAVYAMKNVGERTVNCLWH